MRSDRLPARGSARAHSPLSIPQLPVALYENEHWYVCYTRAHHEKQVDSRLQQRQIESFLPLVPSRRTWHDRQKTVLFPMFPGYLFARCTLNEMPQVVATPGVATVLREQGCPCPVPDAEIANIQRLAAALQGLEAAPEQVMGVGQGERVRIIDGPFAGVEGVVEAQRGRARVLVGLAVLGQSVALNVDVRQLVVLS